MFLTQGLVDHVTVRGTLDDVCLLLLQLAQLSAIDPEDEEGLPAAAHTMLLAVCTDATHGVLLAAYEEGQQLQQSETLAGLTLEGPFGTALTHLRFCFVCAVASVPSLLIQSRLSAVAMVESPAPAFKKGVQDGVSVMQAMHSHQIGWCAAATA